MEFESYQEGVLLYKGVEEGKAALVDGVLAILGKEGEDFSKLLEEEKKKIGNGSPDASGAIGKEQDVKTEAKKMLNSKSQSFQAPPRD